MSAGLGVPALADIAAAPLPDEPWLARSLTWLGRTIDGAAVAVMRTVVDRALMPDPGDMARLRTAAGPYLTGELARDPARFFAFEEAALEPVRVTTHVRRRIAGGTILRHTLTAALAPWAAEPRAIDPIRVEHWAHERRRPRGVVLATHGFAMGNPAIDAVALFAGTWFRAGLDVALLTLPYHGARTPPGARFSGERFASPDPGELNEAVRRAIFEMRVVKRWVRAEIGAPLGLVGLSLGGYLSALLAGLTDDLAFVVPMAPPVCFGDLAARFGPQLLDGTPALSREELRRIFRVHSPLAHPLRVPRERVLVVAGRGDRIVPPEHPHALWRHWGEPAIHWFSGGHLAPFGRVAITAAVLGHLGRVGIV